MSRNKGVKMGVAPLPITPNDALASFACSYCNLMLCWPRGIGSKGRNASIWRYNNDCTELEVKAPQTLWTPVLLNQQRMLLC